MSLLDSEHVRIIEVEDEKSSKKIENTDLNRLREIENLSHLSKAERKALKKKEKDYKGIFFVISLFIGIALARFSHHKEFVMLGLAFGFMFFIDPFYQKVMKKLENM